MHRQAVNSSFCGRVTTVCVMTATTGGSIMSRGQHRSREDGCELRVLQSNSNKFRVPDKSSGVGSQELHESSGVGSQELGFTGTSDLKQQRKK